MYRFWQTTRSTYLFRQPPHKQLPVAKEHFDRWMEIFFTTTDELFAGARAEEAKLRAKNMAEMFNYKINYFRDADQKEIFKFKIKFHAQIISCLLPLAYILV
jgi:hemoglobin